MTELPMTCAEVEALAAELALGAVSGTERAAALSHLAHCPGCRTMVDELGRVADNLLVLAPSAEPPAGFESEVLARISAAARADVRPLRAERGRRLLVGVAAVALVAAAAGAGVTSLASDRRSTDRGTAAAPGPAPAGVRTALVADPTGRWTCRAVVYGDSPTWLVVSLDRTDGLDAGFTVEALSAGRTEAVPVGTFAIRNGHGSLATVVDLRTDDLRSIRVLDSGGRVRYEASFDAS